MVPAQQRLGADDAVGGNVHLRLVVQRQMPLRHGLAQMRLQRQPLARGMGHFFMVEAPGTAPARLGAVHCCVRALQQPLGAGGVARKHANAHTGAGDHLKAIGRTPRHGDGGQ